MSTRPQRADAQRNRDRLLVAAATAFSTAGPDVPLESIAADAGVGIATLYRHFPSREALIEAAYRNELARLCDRALSATEGADGGDAPDVALREWMDRYIDYMSTKRGMADALRTVIESGADPFNESRARLIGAITALAEAGVAAGVVRDDVSAEDVLASLGGISLMAGHPHQREQAGRLLDLLMDGLRPRTPPPRRRRR